MRYVCWACKRMRDGEIIILANTPFPLSSDDKIDKGALVDKTSGRRYDMATGFTACHYCGVQLAWNVVDSNRQAGLRDLMDI